MFSRNHTEEDYKTFCEWWESWGWPAIPYEFLPKNSIVVCGDEPICAVFLYKTDTPICWAENYISSKHSKNRNEALDMLFSVMSERVKDMGCNVVMSSVRHNGLAKRLIKNDFIESDKGLTNYIKGIV